MSESSANTETLTFKNTTSKFDELIELLKYLKLLNEEYRMQFIEHGTIVHDVKSREELAKQIGDAIYNYSSNDLKLSWKADRIHKKVVGLGKLIQKSSNINDVIWRPKCGDIKQQLKNQSVSHKNEYKQILENELTKITQNTHKKESMVTEQCLKLVEMQKRIQNQHLKLMTLHEKLKNLISKTQSMNGH